MIKRGHGSFEFPIEDADGCEQLIEVKWKGYYDPGQFYGPPENCYPPEGEIELDYQLPASVVVEDKAALHEQIEQMAWDMLDEQWGER